MKRRTVILAIEIEGECPDAHALTDDVMSASAGRRSKVIDVHVVDDGVGPDDVVVRRQARLLGQRP